MKEDKISGSKESKSMRCHRGFVCGGGNRLRSI
jgi:hypothetical protein